MSAVKRGFRSTNPQVVISEERARSNAESYAIGYEDGASAAHPLVSFAVGVVAGVITAIFYQAIAARVVAFFS